MEARNEEALQGEPRRVELSQDRAALLNGRHKNAERGRKRCITEIDEARNKEIQRKKQSRKIMAKNPVAPLEQREKMRSIRDVVGKKPENTAALLD